MEFTLSAVNKPQGGVEKDDKGYYKVNLGAVNVKNMKGEYYSADGVKNKFFDAKDTILAQRLAKGYLLGEMGHPNPAEYPNVADFVKRVYTINQENVSHAIREVKMVETPNNGTIFLGWVKPQGPKGTYLQESLDNEDRNTPFSIRSMCVHATNSKTGEKTFKLDEILTWDWVHIPGIETANTWDTRRLGLESESFNSIEINVEVLDEILDKMNSGGINQESNIEFNYFTNIRKKLIKLNTDIVLSW